MIGGAECANVVTPMADFEPWIAAGRAAWPSVAGAEADAALRAWLAAQGVAPGAPAGAHAGDLYLACACARGEARALDAFDRHLTAKVGRFVARIDGSAPFADDVRQALRELLFVGRSPRIGSYGGRGSLEGWVRVTATRLALRKKRDQPPVHPAPAALASPSGSPAADPETALLKLRYRPELAAALEAQVAALADEEHTWLKLYYLDGLTVDQIGRLYHLHASTAWRRLQALVGRLSEGWRSEVALKLGISAGEVDSLLGLVRSQLDISLPGILRKTEH